MSTFIATSSPGCSRGGGESGGVWESPETLHPQPQQFKEEGRGTKNGYEASKGSKGMSGPLIEALKISNRGSKGL